MNKFKTPFLELLLDVKITQDLRTSLIQFASKEQFKLLWELLYNLLHDNIEIKSTEYKKLKRHQKLIDKLITCTNPRELLVSNPVLCAALLQPIRRFLSLDQTV